MCAARTRQLIHINARPQRNTVAGDLQTKESGFGLKGADITEAKRRTVAIVDDDHAVLDSLPILLEVVGHAVEIFASAGRIGHHPTDELLHGLAAFGRRSG
jgi:hypothetical protein